MDMDQDQVHIMCRKSEILFFKNYSLKKSITEEELVKILISTDFCNLMLNDVIFIFHFFPSSLQAWSVLAKS